MRDFTLIIPTHNRGRLFAALLSYLETEKAECHVLVLDSSRPEILTANRARVAASNLDIEFAEFTNISVNEKWRQGAHKVSTPYCALCADDDLVVLEGVRRCLGVLRTNSKASAVQGHSFTFLPRPDGDIELNNIVYFTPTIADATPLKRVARLFEQYQAPSYAAFRTPVLQRIFDTVQPITRILARELLASALTAIEGQIIRIPDFSYGRSMGPSADYEHWHPLEWFSKTPDGLFAEYLRYRELMAAAVIGRSDNDQKPDDVRDILDLISLRYLVKHAPDSALQFIAEQQMAGVDFADYWPSYEIHLPLYAAAGIGPTAVERPLSSIKLRGHRRSYVVFPSFYAPGGTDSPRMDKIVQLIDVLDRYRPGSVEVSTPKTPHEGVPA
jgi:glycosyltransferase domain-containing protein